VTHPLGERWANASYDYSFRFATRSVSDKVVLNLMDNDVSDEFHQGRGQPWDCARQARLVNKPADDGCPLMVFDACFGTLGKAETNATLAAAMRRPGRASASSLNR